MSGGRNGDHDCEQLVLLRLWCVPLFEMFVSFLEVYQHHLEMLFKMLNSDTTSSTTGVIIITTPVTPIAMCGGVLSAFLVPIYAHHSFRLSLWLFILKHEYRHFFSSC